MHLSRSEICPVITFARLHIYADVNAIKKRLRKPVFIALDFQITASTAFMLMVKVSAGTGIHGGNEHNIGRVLDLSVHPGDHDLSVFKRFPEGFKNIL